jgi:small subunit ribosomal protein S17e
MGIAFTQKAPSNKPDTQTRNKYLGKVKTEQVKHLAKDLMTKFPDKFSTSFDENKLMVSKLTIGATTRVRNQVAGYITRTVVLNEKGVPEEEEEVIEEE